MPRGFPLVEYAPSHSAYRLNLSYDRFEGLILNSRNIRSEELYSIGALRQEALSEVGAELHHSRVEFPSWSNSRRGRVPQVRIRLESMDPENPDTPDLVVENRPTTKRPKSGGRGGARRETDPARYRRATRTHRRSTRRSGRR
jgi:hypothetical protein